ncbi:MAG: hypothetical protein WBW55_08585 [Desulfobaccales bacterium]
MPPLSISPAELNTWPGSPWGRRRTLGQAVPFLILALALLERLSAHGIVSPYLNPLVLAIYHFLYS